MGPSDITAVNPELLAYLLKQVTPERKALFEQVIAERTRYITVVLEDIYQPQNASAVLRSCDCFGVQGVHIIENRYEYQVNPKVVMGASKWLDLHRYNQEESDNTTACIEHLRSEGYRILATTPHTEETLLPEIPLDKPVALIFGTELEGLSQQAIDLADGSVRIPMYGFTESFNISVSAALCLQSLTDRVRQIGAPWRLSENDHDRILLEWLRRSIKRCDLLEAAFHEKNN